MLLGRHSRAYSEQTTSFRLTTPTCSFKPSPTWVSFFPRVCDRNLLWLHLTVGSCSAADKVNRQANAWYEIFVCPPIRRGTDHPLTVAVAASCKDGGAVCAADTHASNGCPVGCTDSGGTCTGANCTATESCTVTNTSETAPTCTLSAGTDCSIAEPLCTYVSGACSGTATCTLGVGGAASDCPGTCTYTRYDASLSATFDATGFEDIGSSCPNTDSVQQEEDTSFCATRRCGFFEGTFCGVCDVATVLDAPDTAVALHDEEAPVFQIPAGEGPDRLELFTTTARGSTAPDSSSFVDRPALVTAHVGPDRVLVLPCIDDAECPGFGGVSIDSAMTVIRTASTSPELLLHVIPLPGATWLKSATPPPPPPPPPEPEPEPVPEPESPEPEPEPEPPLPDAYMVAGSDAGQRDGHYVRLPSAECNDKPVYQRDGGHVLFQPTGKEYWMVGPSTQSSSCDSSGWLTSPYTCASGPDRCEGDWVAWAEWDGDAWTDDPAFIVFPASTPPCTAGYTSERFEEMSSWAQSADRYCSSSNSMASYPTFTEAVRACRADSDCLHIYDNACDGSGRWATCMNSGQGASSSGSCMYEKPGSPGGVLLCVDVDECATTYTPTCDANAVCRNAEGPSFTCTCNDGYELAAVPGTGRNTTALQYVGPTTRSLQCAASISTAPAATPAKTADATRAAELAWAAALGFSLALSL